MKRLPVVCFLLGLGVTGAIFAAGELGITLRSGNQQYSTQGQEGVLHTGIQGASKPYAGRVLRS